MTLTMLRRTDRRRTSPQAAAKITGAVKPAMAPRSMLMEFDRTMTLTEAVRELRRQRPTDPQDARLLQQLERELAGPHDYLAIDANGELTKVDPARTTVGDIAASRIVNTPAGVEPTTIAAWEVQAYAPVG